MSKKMWRWIVAITFLIMLVCNSLAGSTTLLNGINTADVSAMYPTLFTPAGYVFAIWGVIYFLLAVFVLYQLGWLGKISSNKDKAISKITPYFVASSVINTVWIFAWQYDVLWLSVLLIVAMLVMLVKIISVLRDLEYTTREKWLIRAPFSVYFGWITVATVANISVWLVSINWDAWGSSPSAWLVAILWVSAFIGLTVARRNRDWLYSMVFVWAFVGILVARLTDGLYWQNDSGIIGTLLVVIVLLAGMTGYQYRVEKEE